MVYTSLNQSKTLSKILPLKSADMYYSHEFVNSAGDYYKINIASEGYFDDEELLGSDIPAWSLASLLEIIPGCELSRSVDNNTKWEASAWKDPELELLMRVEGFDKPIDACYEMILKLHELKML